ncbi:MAG: hypothetical protein JO099_15585 [Acidobacteriia bacterium]|nr:hypothetical protein [Terriglobia bacterium]
MTASIKASPVAAKPSPAGANQSQSQPRTLIYAAAVLYAALVAVTIVLHEPWADEAQAWLLGRDASLVDLWTKLLHYEGSPGLWQTLLHFLIKLDLPYSAYNFVSGSMGLAAAWLFLRYAPLPLWARLLVPFTYFIAYQYAVVARSYALLAPLLFGVAAVYTRAREKPIFVTTLLCLIAGVSVHGVILSACLWLAICGPSIWNERERSPFLTRPWLVAMAVYALVVVLFMLSAWPAHDVAFAEGRGLPNTTVERFEGVLQILFSQAFTGEWITSFVLVGLSIPFLLSGGGALFFLPFAAMFWLFSVVVYSKEWHYGILFLAWLFAVWISATRVKPTRQALVALAAAILVQGYWTVAAVSYDWQHAYSGSAEAVRYLKKTPVQDLYAVGYPTTALQPYFPANLYSDTNNGSRAAYWDWSKRNPANPENDPAAIFSARHRNTVLVGYRRDYEQAFWSHVMSMLGYHPVRHFEGGLFWRDRVLEPEAFDLYHRVPGEAVQSRAVSNVNLGGARSDQQVLAGFYQVEDNAWRWTAKRFSVVLRTPPFAAADGAHLVFRFYLPDAQLAKLGPITLTGDVDGYPLAASTFVKGGNFVYSAGIPREALAFDLVTVNLRFNKASRGLNGDPRELGAVASSIAIEAH